MSWPMENVSATIRSGESESDVISLGGKILGSLHVPAGWTTAVLTMKGSDDGSTFRNIYDAFGNEYQLVMGSGDRSILLDGSLFSSTQFIKLRSGTAAVPVNQGADRTVQLGLRHLP